MKKIGKSSTLLAQLLPFPARVARRKEFYWLNQKISSIYVQQVAPGLEKILRLNTGLKELKVIARHSPEQAARFNFLESDLDLAIILPHWSKVQVTEVLRQVEWARVALPFLGELEFYEPEEWELKQTIRRDHAPIISLVWKLRKWVWQHHKFCTATASYHRQKALRSIQWIKKDLGLQEDPNPNQPTAEPNTNERSQISELFLKIGSLRTLAEPTPGRPSPRGKSEFLEWELGIHGSHFQSPFFLELPASALPGMLALLPGGSAVPDSDPDLIKKLRKNEELSRLFAALCLEEYLTFQSVKREMHSRSGSIDRRWERELFDEIQLYWRGPKIVQTPV